MSPSIAPHVTDKSVVYHYTSASTALEHILRTGELRLSPVGETNDPGDLPPFPEIPTPGGVDPGPRPVIEAVMGFYETGGRQRLACFGLDGAEGVAVATHGVSSEFGWARDRMWGQYGDHHKGICLAFDRARLEVSARQLEKADGTRKIVCGDVAYADQVKYPPWDPSPVKDGNTGGRYREWLETMLPPHFFTKRRDWETEHEYRVLMMDYSADANPYANFHGVEALRFIVVGAKFSDVYGPCIREACDRLGVPSYRYVLDGRRAALESYFTPSRR